MRLRWARTLNPWRVGSGGSILCFARDVLLLKVTKQEKIKHLKNEKALGAPSSSKKSEKKCSQAANGRRAEDVVCHWGGSPESDKEQVSVEAPGLGVVGWWGGGDGDRVKDDDCHQRGGALRRGKNRLGANVVGAKS